jgi:flagellar biosynthesis/type III secretory pathway chaperone
MQTELDRLTEVLQRHADRHRSLLALAEEKRAVIVANDTARLDAITAEEHAILAEVKTIEEERRALVGRLGPALGLAGEPRLDDILARAPGDTGRLTTVREQLRELLAALRQRTAQNAELLRRSVEHIKGFFAALAEVRATAPTYGRGGQRQAGGEQVRLLDQTA